jgi:hypothetical protein
MSGPVPRHDRAGVHVELQCGVQRRRRPGIRAGIAPDRRARAATDRADHAIDLAQCERCGRQQGRAIGHADGVAQLCGDGRPRRVSIPAVQVRTLQTARLLLTVITLEESR